jgi:hypothetical protein
MASVRRANLELLVNRVITQLKGTPNARLIPFLEKILIELHNVREDWAAAVVNKAGEAMKPKILDHIEAIANTLKGIGTAFHIHDLIHLGHPSQEVEVDHLVDPRDIRARFYPSGYRTDAEQHKLQKFRERREMVPLTLPDRWKYFVCCISKKPELTGDSQKYVTVEHLYKVVDHWNNGGNNMTQKERADWYNETANHDVAAWKNNSTDGALAAAAGARMKPTVGPKFRGPHDDK